MKDNYISHAFANFEFEIDELRRDIGIVKEVGDHVQVSVYHDQTVFEPVTIRISNGKPMKVFTPYHRAWLGMTEKDPNVLDPYPPPVKNNPSVTNELKQLFGFKLPHVAQDQQFTSRQDMKCIRELWPPGHDAGMNRMDCFLAQIDNYAATRSTLAANSTSRMSA